ncbi:MULTISPECIES: heavy-metal-associated domain-containing protein [unclassified Streptomyces]|uniref:heavy-metal-associated domain-containing protein n=1 Tax=unclassified Streptomyces TaxID=2593676 RepID=UPI00037A69AB|nr:MULTISPECIES: heavy-metal-associated domain-containing protein [unclassified Streptomyces]MYT28206.1 copper-binding protein [Streptomyces sp. SID8354]
MAENSSCCTPDNSCHTGGGTAVQADAVTTTYKVTGMTCGHCEGAVSSEIGEIAGVSAVQAVASTGLVTITSEAPLDEAEVRAAVDEAGYDLVGQV